MKPEQAGTVAHTHQHGRLSPALRFITNPDIVERGSEDLPRKFATRRALNDGTEVTKRTFE